MKKMELDKKQYSCSKVPFNYLAANTKYSVFRHLEPLASLKDVKTLEEEHYF